MLETVRDLLEEVEKCRDDTFLIREYSPVLYFGNLSNSTIATIGLNPSDKEYYGADDELYERFYSKASLGVDSWDKLTQADLLRLKDTFDHYFNNIPYRAWFNRLEMLFGDSHSYYFPYNNIVHLDIVPVATRIKWGQLPKSQRTYLSATFGKYLGKLISDSPVEICVLNGKSVVEAFQALFDVKLHVSKMERWNIPNKRGIVKGYAYKAILNIAGKQVLALGFNHNIQSSYGVSGVIIREIKLWINSEIENYYERSYHLQ